VFSVVDVSLVFVKFILTFWVVYIAILVYFICLVCGFCSMSGIVYDKAERELKQNWKWG
jgi:hypothetical protein